METCDHFWCYEHSIYAGPRYGTLIRKYCGKCGLELVGEVTRWRPPLPDEFEKRAASPARSSPHP